MLADTVEAACRSLDKPSVPRLDKFIQTLINGKIEHHQLDNCQLTFQDLDKIHDTFVQILAGYYHSRVKYPDQKDPETGESDNPSESKKEETKPSEKDKSDKAEKSEKSEKWITTIHIFNPNTGIDKSKQSECHTSLMKLHLL